VVSSQPVDAIVDTVVLRYFLFVDKFDILGMMLGQPIGIPRIVFDPDEGAVSEETMSELRRSMHVQERRAGDRTRPDSERADAARNSTRLAQLAHLHADGSVVTVDMTDEERGTFSRLTQASSAVKMGLRLPLSGGEAACLAICLHRGARLVTDDTDAIIALKALAPPGDNYRRIRGLLQDAANAAVVTRDEANKVHAEMRRLGFWDTESPF
jgi:hypothetical protein